MNPYSRFGLVSNTVSAAAILTVLAFVGPQFVASLESVGSAGSTSSMLAVGGGVVVMVVFWLAMTEAIFPALFRFNSIRRLILGKYYFEGTWLQSEKGEDHQRLSVIDIQPDGKGFIFSGYSLNEDLEIESNTLIEFSKMEWPLSALIFCRIFEFNQSFFLRSKYKSQEGMKIKVELDSQSSPP